LYYILISKGGMVTGHLRTHTLTPSMLRIQYDWFNGYPYIYWLPSLENSVLVLINGSFTNDVSFKGESQRLCNSSNKIIIFLLKIYQLQIQIYKFTQISISISLKKIKNTQTKKSSQPFPNPIKMQDHTSNKQH